MNPVIPADMTFVGNATTVLRLGDFTLLTDPNFVPAGTRLHLGYGAFTRRLVDPALDVVDLAALDAVLLSHLHADHFDGAARDRLPKELPIVTTPQATRKLRSWRFSEVHGLPTWGEHTWERGGQRLRVTAAPGEHGPGVLNRLLPDVMGSVVELDINGENRLRLYITGDTLLRPVLAEVPRRCGPIDAMIIHLGGTRLLGVLLTMDGAQGAGLTELIRPGLTLPVHYDDYTVMKSPLSDFVDRVRDLGVTTVQPVSRGDTVDLPLRAAR
ncbi:MBL fold metallo-hydrolase [Asanoa sp. WMMD1127]|uniref:MBL fold metallo-hydrolase n=1 Tax=Asanoa sp. WMMD1127 TaxID=3016107 RepID=UPI0024160EF0|nr:MBL fold metallo-hydrolase [Asanoa sp. WMMD1127]MDG4823708.1 MBL fold metallo-hydrolase [Asanoa sp. WMMD1127]